MSGAEIYLAGQTLQTGGQIAQGVSAYGQSRRNASIVKKNAAADAQRFQRDARRRQATTQAQYAAAGVDVNSGSPLNVMVDQALDLAEDQARILFNADVRAQAIKDQGTGALVNSALSAAGTVAETAYTVHRAGGMKKFLAT